MATKLKTKVTYELVDVDAHGKETRQHFIKVNYQYNDFVRSSFPALLVTAAATLNHS
jgi:ribulose 1,5-bisphosphate carboxylase large subunit-like protein